MKEVCSTGIIDVNGKCVEPIKGIPKILLPLVAEARKYPTPQEFSHAFSLDIMHGRYYHITHDQNFTIKEIAPMDASSMVGQSMDVGLMVSSTPHCWKDGYCSKRGYIAEIDLSRAKPEIDYTIVNRGFGQEIFIHNLKSVTVKNVLPIKKGMVEVNRYHRAIEENVGSERKAFALWRKANAKQ